MEISEIAIFWHLWRVFPWFSLGSPGPASCEAWVPLFHFLMGAYGLAVIPLGLSYYFALSHGKFHGWWCDATLFDEMFGEDPNPAEADCFFVFVWEAASITVSSYVSRNLTVHFRVPYHALSIPIHVPLDDVATTAHQNLPVLVRWLFLVSGWISPLHCFRFL